MNRKSKVFLQPIKYRKYDHVAIICLSSTEVDEIVREFEGAEWSVSYHFWHIPLTKEVIKSLKKSLTQVAVVDASSFKDFDYSSIALPTAKIRRKRNPAISVIQKDKIKKVEEFMLLEGYAYSTTKVFCNLINVFFGLVRDKETDTFSPEEINLIVSNYVDENSLTMNYKKLIIGAVNKYYSVINAD